MTLLLCDERILCRTFKGKAVSSGDRSLGSESDVRGMMQRIQQRNAEIADGLFREIAGLG